MLQSSTYGVVSGRKFWYCWYLGVKVKSKNFQFQFIKIIGKKTNKKCIFKTSFDKIANNGINKYRIKFSTKILILCYSYGN